MDIDDKIKELETKEYVLIGSMFDLFENEDAIHNGILKLRDLGREKGFIVCSGTSEERENIYIKRR